MTADLTREVSVAAGARGPDEDADEPAAGGGDGVIGNAREGGNAKWTGVIGTVIDSRLLYFSPRSRRRQRSSRHPAKELPLGHFETDRPLANICKPSY